MYSHVVQNNFVFEYDFLFSPIQISSKEGQYTIPLFPSTTQITKKTIFMSILHRNNLIFFHKLTITLF